jgi:hypothetical protein
MRLRFLVSIAGEEFSHRPGEIAFVEKELAEKWVSGGIAVHFPITISDEAAVKEQTRGQQ